MSFEVFEKREYKILGERYYFGRSQVKIRCPFCKTEEWAYTWVLAGRGKKCRCGATHHSNPPVSKKQVEE